MKLTPFEIQQQQFKTRFRGFDVREVDTFLEQMADAFESLRSENESLREDINRLEHESQGYKQREETFKRAMLNSQKVLEQMKQNRPNWSLLTPKSRRKKSSAEQITGCFIFMEILRN